VVEGVMEWVMGDGVGAVVDVKMGWRGEMDE
jgi:hypothetical protein